MQTMSNVMEEYEKMGYCPNCKVKKALQLIIERRCNIRYVGFFTIDSHELPMSKDEVKFVEDILNEQ